jgi:ATP-dependent Clp protease ATP-binding subunit ClpA
VRERIKDGYEVLSGQVLGQPRAVRKTLDILVRSATGLTAAYQRRPGSGPRGVLFFAGPTGVGKTEMAKAVTRLVFGDERAFVRFDMSEFASEHAEARLLGAPPGYIGHGSGGELTNAVRRRPFTVLLFDEIEKAHPRIMDKFLQVLSDGRLTDGSGATVYFSESIIVFTSNIGAGEVDLSDVPPDEHVGQFEVRMRDSVESYFRDRLGRPELLGRIGDNIVVFQPLGRTIGEQLARQYIANVVDRVAEQQGIHLVVPPPMVERLVMAATADLSKGGRGIGMAVESVFVNPLARALFARTAGGPATVIGLGSDAEGSPVVELR